MQVNFTGIQNISYDYRKYKESIYNGYSLELPLDEDIDKNNYDEDVSEHYINLELTDDENGQDLTEFRKQIKTTDLKGDCLHPVRKNLLNIAIIEEKYTDNTKPDVSIIINNHPDELEINDKNLPMFSYITKLLKRISKADDESFIITKDYLQNDAATSIIPGEDLSEEYSKGYIYKLGEIHAPDNVKKGAENMSKIITDRMLDYFS